MTPQRPTPFADTHAHTTACYWHPHDARWTCRPTAAAMEPALVDTRDMLVVHTALMREFRLAPAAVRRVAEGARRQARRVAAHLRFVSDMLHHHHEGEDELLWPLLNERAPERARELAAGEAQHAELGVALDDVSQLLDAWTQSPDVEARETLAERLEQLSTLLHEHLDLEERDVLPVAAALLQPAEWGAIGARAATAMSKPDLALAFGMFAYEGDPAVLAQMLGEAPPPARLLLPRIAPRLYAHRARRIHGTSRP